jgi:integrase/recombinase XerD
VALRYVHAVKEIIAQFLDHVAFERGLAENTRKAYAQDLEIFATFLAARGAHLFNQVTRRHIIDFLTDQRRQEMAVATIARRLVAVKVLFGYLQREGLLDRNVTEAMTSPKLWRTLPEILAPTDVGRLVDAASGDRAQAVRDHAILELFYACGLRVSEVASLRVTDVQFDGGFVRCTGKGDKQRVVPLGQAAAGSIRRYLAQVRPRWAQKHPGVEQLFLSQQGKGFTRQGLYKLIVHYAREAGLGGRVTPHTLRHCFASHLLANGAQLRAIQEMLGHASIATTQIYTHVDQDRLVAVHKKFHPRA